MAKFANCKLKLTSADTNPQDLMKRATTILKGARVPEDKIDEFQKECLSGDYNHMLNTVMDWFDVD